MLIQFLALLFSVIIIATIKLRFTILNFSVCTLHVFSSAADCPALQCEIDSETILCQATLLFWGAY